MRINRLAPLATRTEGRFAVSVTTAGADASATRTLVASRLEDLDRLRGERRPAGTLSVALVLPGLEDERRENLERRMSRLLTACGCGEGTVAGLLYLVIVPVLLFTGVLAAGSLGGWAMLGFGFIAALLLGKIVGLAVARVRLLLTVNELERLFLDPSLRD